MKISEFLNKVLGEPLPLRNLRFGDAISSIPVFYSTFLVITVGLGVPCSKKVLFLSMLPAIILWVFKVLFRNKYWYNRLLFW